MTEQSQIGRLALRVEGDNWNAYWAEVGTLDGAIFLGSIKMAFVTQSAKRKQQFMDLMAACAADALQDILGERPAWNPPREAPDGERSGNA